MLNKVFNRMRFPVLIMSGRTASMILKNSNSWSRIFCIRYSNMELALVVLALKNVASLIRFDSLI